MIGLKIRQASADDIAAICDIDARAFGEGPYAEARDKVSRPGWRRERRLEIEAWYREHYRETFVAIVDGRVAGFAGYRPVVGNVGVVDNNAVDPTLQGRGISTALVKRVVQELVARGAKRIEVETAHVLAAVRVYEKAGFKVTAQHGARTHLEHLPQRQMT
jgi:GNAT superfamily N-acetyltransferase